MANFFDQLKAFLDQLSMMRKLSILIALVASITVISYLVHLSRKTSMEPLFTNLNSEDIGSIVSQLDNQGVRYNVDQERRTISVPSTQVLETRMKLAADGLPRFGGVGFELFDKNGFGRSDFEQKVIYQRALEGELTRTILSMKQVEKVRVHLVLPEKTLFSENREQARASVILKLGGGGTLADSSVSSITHLVASAVEGLDSSRVTVVDTSGRLLTSPDGDSNSLAGTSAFNQKTKIEKSFENRIVDLLSPVIGAGKVIARVTADLDYTSVETTDELVDPTKTAVIQESKTTSKKKEEGAGGAAAAATATSGSNADENTEQATYQVSKTTRHQRSPMGSIKKISAAILVDGIYTEKAGKQVFGPRPPEEMARLETLIKNAIGFSPDRGDQIKVENFAFLSSQDLAASDTWLQKKNTYGLLMNVASNVLIVFAIIAIFFFVVRPLIRDWTSARGGSVVAAGGGTPMLEAGGTGNGKGDVIQLVKTNPAAAAVTIRKWLQEGGG